MFAALAPFLAPAITAGAGSFLANQGRAPAQTQMQQKQKQVIDMLMDGLTHGRGPYADLFSGNEEAFQKSFVQPAQARFRNQIAPQIQQQYIAGGQQRGTGLDDQLLRAGVDLNSMLDEKYMGFQQDAMNRKQNAITGILGAGSGTPNETSGFQDVMSGLGGYLSSSGLSDQFANLFKKPQQPWGTPPIVGGGQIRKGFAS